MADNPLPIEEKAVDPVRPVEEKTPDTDSGNSLPAVPTPPVEPQKPRPSWLYRCFQAVLSPQTRLGRFMRPALRWTAAVVGLFALGMLATYLLLYTPVVQQLEDTNVELQFSQQEVSKTSLSLAEVQKNLADLQTQYATSQTALKKAGSRIILLQVSNQIAAARLALTNKDGAAAQKALAGARFSLDQVLPDVKIVDVNAATQLDSRLSLVVSELNDPATAQADLALLANRLGELDSAFQ